MSTWEGNKRRVAEEGRRPLTVARRQKGRKGKRLGVRRVVFDWYVREQRLFERRLVRVSNLTLKKILLAFRGLLLE